jgi:cytochrome c553
VAEKWQCTLCHGPDGNGNKVSARTEMSEAWSTPRISAQPQAYFIKSMQDYKTGKRSNDDMQLMAKQLSDDEIRDLAAWYGSQTPRAEATYEYDPER